MTHEILKEYWKKSSFVSVFSTVDTPVTTVTSVSVTTILATCYLLVQ